MVVNLGHIQILFIQSSKCWWIQSFRAVILMVLPVLAKGSILTCLAAGGYCRKDGVCLPLIATSSNGGKSGSIQILYTPILIWLILSLDMVSSVTLVARNGRVQFLYGLRAIFQQCWRHIPLVAISQITVIHGLILLIFIKILLPNIDPDLAIASFSRAATSGGQLSAPIGNMNLDI